MINFVTLNISFSIKNKRKIKRWIKHIIKEKNMKSGELTYIFTDDKNILEINQKYLNHDYYTDIITFDYCQNNIISGDIFISIDRVIENSNTYNVSFTQELLRIIVHGILHLLGYNDHTDIERIEMRKNEDISLSKLKLKNI